MEGVVFLGAMSVVMMSSMSQTLKPLQVVVYAALFLQQPHRSVVTCSSAVTSLDKHMVTPEAPAETDGCIMCIILIICEGAD